MSGAMERLGRNLAQAVEHLPGAELHAAQETIAQLEAKFDHATSGSQNPDVVDTLAHLRAASDALGQALAKAHQALRAISEYGNRLGVVPPIRGQLPGAGGGAARPSAPAAAGSRGENVPASPSPAQPGAASATEQRRTPHEILASLPVFAGKGSKTRGVFVGPDGKEESLISSEDARTKALAARQGLAGVWSAETHVEAHAAEAMHRKGLQEATLVINRRPCPGMQGCDTLLPRLLPSGARLTVHGPDGFVKTYEGR